MDVPTRTSRRSTAAPATALTGDESAVKFLENAELVMSRGRAEQIRDGILDMDRRTAREIAALLGGA